MEVQDIRFVWEGGLDSAG